MSGEKEMLRASDVAPMLGVTTGRVYQLIAAGILPATRIGGAIRIPRAAWEAWLRDQGALAQGTTQRANGLRDGSHSKRGGRNG